MKEGARFLGEKSIEESTKMWTVSFIFPFALWSLVISYMDDVEVAGRSYVRATLISPLHRVQPLPWHDVFLISICLHRDVFEFSHSVDVPCLTLIRSLSKRRCTMRGGIRKSSTPSSSCRWRTALLRTHLHALEPQLKTLHAAHACVHNREKGQGIGFQDTSAGVQSHSHVVHPPPGISSRCMLPSTP